MRTLFLLGMIFCVNLAYAAQIGTLTTFSTGTTAVASQVNGNFTALSNAVNDNDTRITALSACPAGFTNVTAAGNQLGCMQTTEQGSGSWETASNTCFTTFGGRLPTSGEWYITMNNFVLTAEADNFEWNDDADVISALNQHAASGSPSIITSDNANDVSILAFRCWIPK